MRSDSLLRNLRALANIRRARGDGNLKLCPSPTPQEQFEPTAEMGGGEDQGLVLEPNEGSPFVMRDLSPRSVETSIGGFCDGIRSTYFLGYEDVYPILYTENAAGVRIRDQKTGYHLLMSKMHRRENMLLAPFGLFPRPIRQAYERLGLCPSPHSDLCWTSPDDDEFGVSPSDWSRMGSLGWQTRGRRRARRLLDRTEQLVALAGSRVLREKDGDRPEWLLKDGALTQFDRAFLQQPEKIRNVVACVKTHPVSFFGAEGERNISELAVGQRSVAFLPRPIREADNKVTLREAYRPFASWYLRVHPRLPASPNPLSGIVRLDIAATPEWSTHVDEVSWAVLDEFYSLSALPDPRSDVMPFGVFDCEQFLKAYRLSGELLLAELN